MSERRRIARAFLLMAAALFITTDVSCGACGALKKPYADVVVSGDIVVSPLSHESRVICVDNRMSDAYLRGDFHANGGLGNDIKVLVMSEEDYVNWANGHEANALYSSGRKTAGSFNLALREPGTYRVVYDNGFAFIFRKTVASRVTLEYRK